MIVLHPLNLLKELLIIIVIQLHVICAHYEIPVKVFFSKLVFEQSKNTK